ncbi:DUF6457 domain-containing protein [Sinomonas halotolerans]|uniref:DUF6457 domain-containing protein n=1 Tax=Sinomonas halotolerans TaxID=1644133 RepID=A0ABU9X2U2_9MICC
MSEHAADNDREIAQWSRRLAQALQILDFELDQALVRRVAEESARSVSPDAGPVSALMVGYAAGLASRNGKQETQSALEKAAATVLRLCEDGTDGGPDRKGWTDTAQ